MRSADMPNAPPGSPVTVKTDKPTTHFNNDILSVLLMMKYLGFSSQRKNLFGAMLQHPVVEFRVFIVPLNVVVPIRYNRQPQIF